MQAMKETGAWFTHDQLLKPIVSGVRGWAVGRAACALLAMCPLLRKTPTSWTGTPRSVWRRRLRHDDLALLVSMAKAKYYLLCCEKLDGAEPSASAWFHGGG